MNTAEYYRENFQPNRWFHYSTANPGTIVRAVQRNNSTSLYPSPQTVLRLSTGEVEYANRNQTITAAHIRASAIFDLGIDYRSCLNESWSMIYRQPSWHMVIVSAQDPVQWIQQARFYGARAWLQAGKMTTIYQWEPQQPRSRAIEDHNSDRNLPYRDYQQKKKYNLEQMKRDLQTEESYSSIGRRYGVSAVTVSRIAERTGLKRK